jgi:thiamine-phosphate pyrophosphorylase
MILVLTKPEWEQQDAGYKEFAMMAALLDQGLPVLHLRKPDASLEDLSSLMSRFTMLQRSRIALHPPLWLFQSCSLMEAITILESFMNSQNLERIHIPSWFRKLLGAYFVPFCCKMQQSGFLLSASIHHLNELGALKGGHNDLINYQYIFVSPIFDSISKPGYKRNPDLLQLDTAFNHTISEKLVGLGGIGPDNLRRVKRAGFAGAAMLGAIWAGCFQKALTDSIEKIICQFKKCVDLWESMEQD